MSQLLAQQAYDALKRQIIRCQLAPGMQVSEVDLAERLGFGRAAIRTALNRLSQERLVDPIPRRGHIVTPVTFKDVRDLFHVRRMLEPPAVAQVAASRAELSHLAELEARCREASARDDYERAARFLEANTELHVAIVAATGNERLGEMFRGLLEEMERLFHLGLRLTDRWEEMYHEHWELLTTLGDRDPVRARQVAERQIDASEQMVMTALLASPTLASVNIASA